MAEHSKGARKSQKDAHEHGQQRKKKMDQGGEKKDTSGRYKGQQRKRRRLQDE
ncbi:MAG TPA: hypothetical protein VHR66_31945 [Gemmataceae bacterium]|jgi:hypothetical protein|nr:hypothetical protein [Gemmataceae bacterium]